MKIGIITMPLCSNYGGTLQNWALQQVLKRMGHEPITLRFPVKYQGMSSVNYWLRVFPMQVARLIVHKFIGGKYEMPLTIGQWKRSVQGMERFVKERIYVTEYLPNLSIEDVYRYGIEVLVVGSDQIWRPVMYDAVKYYFLGFAKNSDIHRIAYAPSIALDEWPFSKDITEQLKELSQRFSAISVRELSSVKLLKDNLGIDSQWVLDPTFLLKKDDYLELCKDVAQTAKPFVFAYILDMTEEKRKMAMHIASILNSTVIYLTADKTKAEDTIENWLAYFRDSAYVVTDSYHGTVFSLIFRKQFYCFYNAKRGSARMDTLKKLTGLNNRFLQQSSEKLDIEIDYTEVVKNIDKMRDSSLKFLKEVIN